MQRMKTHCRASTGPISWRYLACRWAIERESWEHDAKRTEYCILSFRYLTSEALAVPFFVEQVLDGKNGVGLVVEKLTELVLD